MTFRPTATTAVLAALLLAASAHAATPPIVRAPQDEIIYQIMPIAWRDSNLDTVGSVSTRFGDFGGLFARSGVDDCRARLG